MSPDDATPFRDRLAAVYALYGKQIDQHLVSFWWEAMRPFDFDAVKGALNRHAVNPDNGQYVPKPADVVKLIGGGTQDAALIAWAKVMKAAREVGTYRTVVFDDALIHAVLNDMGGWLAIGQINEDELPFKAREFENRYRAFALRAERPTYPSRLIGIMDQSNVTRGFGEDLPVLIGDPQRAQWVMDHGGRGSGLEITRLLPDGVPKLTSKEPA